MTRWLPYPLMSAALFIMWLLLNQSVAAAHLVAGALLALGGPLAMRALELPRASIGRVRAVIKLAWLVLVDIVRSNNAVASIILSPDQSRHTSGFVAIPLDLRDRYGLTTLAIIITSTPGTLWANYDSTTGVMTLHVLDLIDESAWADRIKQRYESLLVEIFE
jgi:multicomponent K+:H+ antiporter subunit E